MGPLTLLFKDSIVTAAIGIFLSALFACNTCLSEDGKRENGIFRPCPPTPNCVSSRAEKARQRVDPIVFRGDPAAAWSRLRLVVASMKGARITKEKAGYLHAEFRSALFGFVDDVELKLTEAAERIDVRSASRTGYYDFGVNRRRVEEIRERFARKP
jgi:uncharacterized protein (DUF1499 family)